MGKVNRPPPKYKATRLPVPDVRAYLGEIMQRISAKVVHTEAGCVEWLGFKSWLGYGSITFKNRAWMVHRLIYAAHYGPFDPWLDIRHSCDNPACVKIEHLSLGTRSDNMRDSVDRKRSKNSKKTHCPKGHSYAEWGVSFVRGNYKPWRACRVCQLARYRIRNGWPERFAYDMSIKVPNGYMLDRQTGRVISVRGQRP